MSKDMFNKLEDIEGNAEVNVQADWDEGDDTLDAFIKNKPAIPVDLTVSGSGTVHADNYTDTTYSPADGGTDGTDGTDGLLEDSDKFKLDGIEDSANNYVLPDDVVIDEDYVATANDYTDTDKDKVANTESTTQLDDRDTDNRDRGNHTGTQAADTITETDTIKLMSDTERINLSNLANATGVTDTVYRYDKMLSATDIIEMVYTDGDLTTVRYTDDDADNDVYYRDELTYTDGNLTGVKHYYDTADLDTESSKSSLTYSDDDDLVSTTYTED